jgi:hypothetical protein
MLDVTKKDLMQAPGFDKNNWPDFSDQKQSIVTYESTPSRCQMRGHLQKKEEVDPPDRIGSQGTLPGLVA